MMMMTMIVYHPLNYSMIDWAIHSMYVSLWTMALDICMNASNGQATIDVPMPIEMIYELILSYKVYYCSLTSIRRQYYREKEMVQKMKEIELEFFFFCFVFVLMVKDDLTYRTDSI